MEPIVNGYKKHGVNGLTMADSTGIPRLLNDEQEKEFIQTITNNMPDRVGFMLRKNRLLN